MGRARRPRRSPSSPAGELERGRQRGHLVLPGTPGVDVAEVIEDRLRALIDAGGPDLDDTGGTVHLAGLEGDPVVAECLSHPGLGRVVSYLLGEEPRLWSARYRSPKPGGGAQALHRDEPWPEPDGRWASATVIVALADFTSTNGATRLVPGTHRDRVPFKPRSVGYRHPDEVLLTAAAGGALVFTGACLHSGTANTTATPRPGLQATFGPRRRIAPRTTRASSPPPPADRYQ